MQLDPWTISDKIPELARHEVQLFKISRAQILEEINLYELREYLSSLELERANKFKFKKDIANYIISRGVVRIASATLINTVPRSIDFGFNEYGKPHLLNDESIKFNISHSGDLILIGFCREFELGVDVEVYNNQIDYRDLATSVFSKTEINDLESSKEESLQHCFYNIWSKKESYIKAIGQGLQIPLDQFSVRAFDIGHHNLINVGWDDNEIKRWKLFNVEIQKSYAAAITINESIQSIKMLKISSDFFNK